MILLARRAAAAHDGKVLVSEVEDGSADVPRE